MFSRPELGARTFTQNCVPPAATLHFTLNLEKSHYTSPSNLEKSASPAGLNSRRDARDRDCKEEQPNTLQVSRIRIPTRPPTPHMISTLRPTSSVRPGRLVGGARPVRGRRTQVRLAAAATANRDLVRSLVEQARKETLPWVSDLLDPLMRRGIDGSAATAASSLPPPVHPRELADADSRFVEVDGVAVHYKEAPGANPSAPTVMLIHGFNGSTFSWRNTLEEVAATTGCRAVTYDRPPFGLTQRPLEWGRPGQALQYNPYELAGSVTLLEGGHA